MSNIAVILTVFNRKSKTLGCLQRIADQVAIDGTFVDIFITDGGSNDGTVVDVKKKFPNVEIEVVDGVFWNRGMYHSWEKATAKKNYDYYFWLNDDVELYPNCISVLVSVSKQKADKSIIVGATVDSITKEIPTYGGRNKNGEIPSLTGKEIEVDHFNGNIVLIPASVYAQLGNLDYYYTHSKGDYDYGIRAKKVGIKMFQVGIALGVCDVHPRIDKWCDPEMPLLTRLRMLYKPNGMPPHETFHFERKTNLGIAIFHYFTVHIRCLLPWVWTRG